MAGMRRRAAMWLIAAWAVFSVTQVFAACCVTPGNAADTAADTAIVMHAHHADAHEDCCPPSEPSCPMVLEEAPLPLASSLGLFAFDQSQHVLLPVSSVPVRVALAPRVDYRAHAAISQAPPDPIYLRLQRLLI
jgi:hypothetical protein